MSLGPHNAQSFTARLSPADQIAPLSHTNVMLAFGTMDGAGTASRLEWAIKLFCEQLPWMAGRIHRGKGGYTNLTWSTGDQVLFEHKPPAKPLPSYRELKEQMMPLHELEHDFRPTGHITREYHECPGDLWQAMLACYTMLDGGLVVCISLHHHLVGGTAVATLIHRIASICRGETQVSDSLATLDAMTPLHRFRLITEALGMQTNQQDFGGSEESENLARDSDTLPMQGKSQNVDLSIKVFSVRRSSVNALRDALMSYTGGSRPTLTAVLAGLMWCAFNQARSRRKLEDEDDCHSSVSTLLLPVPANRLLDQGSAEQSGDFIGNLLSAAIVKNKISNLAADCGGRLPAALPIALRQIASAITAAQDYNLIQGKLRQVMLVKDMRALSQPSTMGANDLLVTNWGGLPMSFNFGPEIGCSEFVRPMVGPVTQRTTHRSFYSYVVILPFSNRENHEDIQMLSCFERSDMAEIEQNPLLVRLQRSPFKL